MTMAGNFVIIISIFESACSTNFFADETEAPRRVSVHQVFFLTNREC